MTTTPIHDGPMKSSDTFHIAELSKLLDAPVERVRGWLRAERIAPVDPGAPDRFEPASLERLRARQQI